MSLLAFAFAWYNLRRTLNSGGIKLGQVEWEHLTSAEKKQELYLRQKDVLDKFLERGAISRAQYEKSLGDLTAKMGIVKDGSEKKITIREP